MFSSNIMFSSIFKSCDRFLCRGNIGHVYMFAIDADYNAVEENNGYGDSDDFFLWCSFCQI